MELILYVTTNKLRLVELLVLVWYLSPTNTARAPRTPSIYFYTTQNQPRRKDRIEEWSGHYLSLKSNFPFFNLRQCNHNLGEIKFIMVAQWMRSNCIILYTLWLCLHGFTFVFIPIDYHLIIRIEYGMMKVKCLSFPHIFSGMMMEIIEALTTDSVDCARKRLSFAILEVFYIHNTASGGCLPQVFS